MALFPHIRLPHPALCLCSHPTSPLLASGLTTGGIVLVNASHLPRSSSTAPSPSPITHPLPTPCRALTLLPTAPSLLAATPSAEIHLFDASRPTPIHTYTLPVAAESESGPVSATALTALEGPLIAAGDDAGGLHLLDVRTSGAPAISVLEQGDYVSAIRPVDRFGTSAVLAASGDGAVCAYEIRAPPRPRLRLQYATDGFDDDLLSLGVLPAAPVAVAGTLSGALNLYNLRFLDAECEAEAAAHVDRFYGHPECVNAVLPFGEEGLVVTASSDGIVRVVDVLAKGLVGVLDYAKDEGGAGVDGERADLQRKRKKKKVEAWPIEDMVSIAGLEKPGFALLGHDECIRFCDGGALVDDEKVPKEGDHPGENANEDAGSQRAPEENAQGSDQERRFRKKKKRKRALFETEKKPTRPKDFFNDL